MEEMNQVIKKLEQYIEMSDQYLMLERAKRTRGEYSRSGVVSVKDHAYSFTIRVRETPFTVRIDVGLGIECPPQYRNLMARGLTELAEVQSLFGYIRMDRGGNLFYCAENYCNGDPENFLVHLLFFEHCIAELTQGSGSVCDRLSAFACGTLPGDLCLDVAKNEETVSEKEYYEPPEESCFGISEFFKKYLERKPEVSVVMEDDEEDDDGGKDNDGDAESDPEDYKDGDREEPEEPEDKSFEEVFSDDDDDDDDLF